MSAPPNRTERKRRLPSSYICLNLLEPPRFLPVNLPPLLLLRYERRLPLPLHTIRPLQISCRITRQIQISLVEKHIDTRVEEIEDLWLHGNTQVVREFERLRYVIRIDLVLLDRRRDVKRLPHPRQIQILPDIWDLKVAQIILCLTRMRDIEPVPVAPFVPRLAVVVLDDARPADLRRSLADRWVGVVVAYFREVHAAG